MLQWERIQNPSRKDGQEEATDDYLHAPDRSIGLTQIIVTTVGDQEGLLQPSETAGAPIDGQGISQVPAELQITSEGVRAAGERNAPVSTIAIGSPTTAFSVRYMILQKLAERNEPTYASMISKELEQYGVTKERILIELNKLTNSTSKPVKRNKSPFNRRYLYLITENGVNELKKRKNTILKGNELTIESPPLDPYLWLLENLTEPMTIEDLTALRGDSEVTIRVYLSQLYKLGAIEKRKEPEEKTISQRNRNGDMISRTTTVFKTYYCMKEGPLKDKLAETPGFEALGKPVQTFKMEVPIPNTAVKDPVFTPQEEDEYQKWREGTRDIEEFNKAILKKANKTGIRAATAYRLVFKQLKDSGRI